jgi:hypothetical protein
MTTMKRLVFMLATVLALCQAPFVYALDGTFDAESSYPASLDTGSTNYFNKSQGDTVQHYDHDVQSDAICEIEEKLGSGDSTAVVNTILTGTGAGTSSWSYLTPAMLDDNSYGEGIGDDGLCLTFTYNDNDPFFSWASCGSGGGGGGDSILVAGIGVNTNVNFLNTSGDVDWTLTAGTPDTIYGTVTCSGCIDATDLASNSVANAEMQDNAIGNAEMNDNAIGNAEILDNAVGQAEMLDDAIGTDELDDGTDTPVAGQYVVVATGATEFEYITLDSTLTDLSDANISSEGFSATGSSLNVGSTTAATDFNVRNGTTSQGYIDLVEDADNGTTDYISRGIREGTFYYWKRCP